MNTDKRLADTLERLKEVEAERDVARRDYDVMYRFYLGEEERADALAAHVERMTELLERGMLPSGCIEVFEYDVERAIKDTPETSLARLKPQWQAEALEDFASRIEHLDGLTTGKRMAEEARLMAEGCS